MSEPESRSRSRPRADAVGGSDDDADAERVAKRPRVDASATTTTTTDDVLFTYRPRFASGVEAGRTTATRDANVVTRSALDRFIGSIDGGRLSDLCIGWALHTFMLDAERVTRDVCVVYPDQLESAALRNGGFARKCIPRLLTGASDPAVLERFMHKRWFVSVVNANNNHWVFCAARSFNGVVHVHTYDSLRSVGFDASDAEESAAERLVDAVWGADAARDFDLKVRSCAVQRNTTDCGVFALAAAREWLYSDQFGRRSFAPAPASSSSSSPTSTSTTRAASSAPCNSPAFFAFTSSSAKTRPSSSTVVPPLNVAYEREAYASSIRACADLAATVSASATSDERPRQESARSDTEDD